MLAQHLSNGYISHTYADHVSIRKFIEYNWGLPPINGRSRDNLPNPTPSSSSPTFRPTVRRLTTCLTCSASTDRLNGIQPQRRAFNRG
jgi:hypothetical protein